MSELCDSKVLALQIGRPLRATSTVLRRCDLGLPIVADVPPVLDTGEPFPTRYWLTCPLAHRRIARLEARGGVRKTQMEIEADPSLASALAEAHARYAQERDASVPADVRHRPSGGVGGSSGGVKCLHAHYADFAAGNDNPVGLRVHAEIGEPRCELPCVTFIDGKLRRNPDWREPADDEQP
ncbi:MAG: DUF501 domain-containing protein [Deltaproteobacteria bacterium]|jgi:hypothetical protein|nr:DUF501 domain-containing protein [Deltaproteobacteria bacterium]